MFSIKPNLSKAYILNHTTEEQIFEHYLGVSITTKAFRNPMRNDKSPSCSFYKTNTGRLMMCDYTGYFKGDCFELVMFKFNTDFPGALKIIANDFGIVKSNTPRNEALIQYSNKTIDTSTPAVIQAEIKDFTTEELAWWSKFGISYNTLKLYHVFSIKHVFLNNSIYYSSTPSSPIYGYYFGKHDDLELWKMYCPRRTSNRFLGNAKGLQGYHMLPKTGELVVITKSLKDCMVFYELGIPAVAPHSEGIVISQDDYNELTERFKLVVVVYDGDRPGIHGMMKYRKKYGSICIACSIKPKKEAKDISDCMAKYGKETVMNKINELKIKYEVQSL